MLSDSFGNNKRIAKNTLILYVRMLILMATSLYTSRVILDALGAEDYGIYNVVGGVVIFLGFLNGTLNTTSSRYITVALGKGDGVRCKQVFASVLQVNILLCIFVVLASETIGLWFLVNKMQIPEERMNAALWVYQFSVATVILNIISVPYSASIIAHERMQVFAYIVLFDAFAKLGIAFLLSSACSIDKLVVYAICIFIVQLIDRVIYGQYCVRKFPETHYSPYYDGKLLKEILGFVSWSAYGGIVFVGFTQGLNILLNIFFGPAINAARAVSVQVQSNVDNFVQNFQTAINPQLTKSVATASFEKSRELLLASTRFSFYLLCILGLPIICEADYILHLWLKEVPQHTVLFVQLMLTISIWQSFANSLRTVNQAEGNIKKFQMYECTLRLLIVPIAYIFLKKGYPPESVFIVHLMIELMVNIPRIWIVLPKIGMKSREYIRQVYFKLIPIYVIPILIVHFFMKPFVPKGENTFVFFLLSLLVIEVSLMIMISGWGLTIGEKNFIKKVIKGKFEKRNLK